MATFNPPCPLLTPPHQPPSAPNYPLPTLQACPAAFYALLMMGGHIIAADRAKSQPSLDPLDVLLLSNFVTSNPAYR